MKTDETNLIRDPAHVETPISVRPVVGASSAHAKAAAEQERDALDAWRDSLDDERRAPPDPVQVHGFDLEASDPHTRMVIDAFSADLAQLHKALEAAEARLAWSEEIRRHDPETSLLRRDALMSEVWHLEFLDHQEGGVSELVLLKVDRFSAFRDSFGRVAAEKVMVALGKVLAEASDPAEPAGRVGDGEFVVLLTGLSGPAAEQRSAALASVLVDEIDRATEAVELRPGQISIGRTNLDSMEDPGLALNRADQNFSTAL